MAASIAKQKLFFAYLNLESVVAEPFGTIHTRDGRRCLHISCTRCMARHGSVVHQTPLSRPFGNLGHTRKLSVSLGIMSHVSHRVSSVSLRALFLDPCTDDDDAIGVLQLSDSRRHREPVPRGVRLENLRALRVESRTKSFRISRSDCKCQNRIHVSRVLRMRSLRLRAQMSDTSPLCSHRTHRPAKGTATLGCEGALGA